LQDSALFILSAARQALDATGDTAAPGAHGKVEHWSYFVTMCHYLYGKATVLLAPTGALIVIVVYYTSGRRPLFEILSISAKYLVFLFEN